MIEKTEGLAVHGVERETSLERVTLKEVVYFSDCSRNDEVDEGLIDLRAELAPESDSAVGFWLDAAEEGVGAKLVGVHLLRRSEDGRSFTCGSVEAIGLNDNGEPEYGTPELFDELPAEFVEAHLLRGPLEVGAPSTFFGGMTIAKVGILREHVTADYTRGRWGENPILKIITVPKIVPSTQP